MEFPISLKNALEKKKEQILSSVPAETAATMENATEELRQTGIEGSALKKGDKAPDVQFTTANGAPFRLHESMANGPVVLTFFRGHW